MSKAAKLRKLIEEPGIVVLPGAHDVLSAKLFEQAGFDAVFTSGFGLSATSLGVPDYGLLTATETLDRVRRIVDAVSVPVVADMDTGYGNPLNVVRTVQECVRVGGGWCGPGRPALAQEVRPHGGEASDPGRGPCAEDTRSRIRS